RPYRGLLQGRVGRLRRRRDGTAGVATNPRTLECRRRRPEQAATASLDPHHRPRSQLAARLPRSRRARVPACPSPGRVNARASSSQDARPAANPRTVLWIGILIIIRFVLMLFSLVETEQGGTLPIGTQTVIAADATRYHTIAITPGTPYKDFQVEYPPVALGEIEA